MACETPVGLFLAANFETNRLTGDDGVPWLATADAAGELWAALSGAIPN